MEDHDKVPWLFDSESSPGVPVRPLTAGEEVAPFSLDILPTPPQPSNLPTGLDQLRTSSDTAPAAPHQCLDWHPDLEKTPASPREVILTPRSQPCSPRGTNPRGATAPKSPSSSRWRRTTPPATPPKSAPFSPRLAPFTPRLCNGPEIDPDDLKPKPGLVGFSRAMEWTEQHHIPLSSKIGCPLFSATKQKYEPNPNWNLTESREVSASEKETMSTEPSRPRGVQFDNADTRSEASVFIELKPDGSDSGAADVDPRDLSTHSKRRSNNLKKSGATARMSLVKQATLNSMLSLAFDHSVSDSATALAHSLDDRTEFDASLLRGITCATLMENSGRHFAVGVSYGATTGQKSPNFQVERVDDFISHSWRASRWAKYMALLLIYNSQAAIWLSSIASLIALGTTQLLPRFFNDSEVRLYCCLSGCIAYVFFIKFYQRSRQALRRPLRTAFFDKLCIDQEDTERLKMGIRSLNVFLAASQRMVIFWDRTYFTRAWCICEIAMRESFERKRIAAKEEDPNNEAEGRMRHETLFVPLQLAYTVVSFTIPFWITINTFVVVLNLESYNLTYDKAIACAISHFFIFFFGSIAAMHGRHYARDREHLDYELAHFSWQNAQCFNQQDYNVLTVLLTNWFESVTQFDDYVNTDFRDLILQQLGGHDAVSFAWTWPVAVATFCCELDLLALELYYGSRSTVGHISLLCAILASVIFGVPVIFRCFLWICRRTCRERQSRLCEVILNITVSLIGYIISAVVLGTPHAFDHLFAKEGFKVFFAFQLLYDGTLGTLCVLTVKFRCGI